MREECGGAAVITVQGVPCWPARMMLQNAHQCLLRHAHSVDKSAAHAGAGLTHALISNCAAT